MGACHGLSWPLVTAGYLRFWVPRQPPLLTAFCQRRPTAAVTSSRDKQPWLGQAAVTSSHDQSWQAAVTSSDKQQWQVARSDHSLRLRVDHACCPVQQCPQLPASKIVEESSGLVGTSRDPIGNIWGCHGKINAKKWRRKIAPKGYRKQKLQKVLLSRKS